MHTNIRTRTLTNTRKTWHAAVLPLLLLTGCDDAPAADAGELREAEENSPDDLDPKLAVTLGESTPGITHHGDLIDGDPGTDLWTSEHGSHDGWHYIDLDLGGRHNVTAIRMLEDDMVEWGGWGVDQWEFEIYDGGTQQFWSGTLESNTNEWQTVDNPDHEGDRIRVWLHAWSDQLSVREVEVRGTALDEPPCNSSGDPSGGEAGDPSGGEAGDPSGDPSGGEAGDPSGGEAGVGGMPDAPGGWVVDLDDDFDTLEWNNWKQQQNNVPLLHSILYWNSASHCVPVGGYLEMRARKRNDGSGAWDGCYIDQGTWWDSNNDRPAHPGYEDYQVSFKAELPAGLGAGIYALMWPIAESWGGSPWPPELDILELPYNDGSEIMVTWHYSDPDHKFESTFPKFDRTGGKEWVYTVRRVAGETRMWIGDPDTNAITEIELPESLTTNPHNEMRLVLGLSNFVASNWAVNGSPSAFWYGDVNDTDMTAWTGRIDWVKIYKPGPGMSGE